MRINRFIANATGLSRREVDRLLEEQGVVLVNGSPAEIGQEVTQGDQVSLRGQVLSSTQKSQTVMLNKPVGYVVSREGQGAPTVYELLPDNLKHLKAVGRLDKNSSGLLLLTNDGVLANQLTHPSFEKTKTYQIELDKPLTDQDFHKLLDGVILEDGLSRFVSLKLLKGQSYEAGLNEGRNRQIRRTFKTLGYRVIRLHRTAFGPYNLNSLPSGKFDQIKI